MYPCSVACIKSIQKKGLGWGPTPPSGAVATGGSGAPHTPVGRPAAPPPKYDAPHTPAHALARLRVGRACATHAQQTPAESA